MSEIPQAPVVQAPKAPELPPEPPAPEVEVAIRRSACLGKFAKALAQAQGQMRSAVKDSTNPHFKNQFASLASIIDVIREPLATAEIAWTQHATTAGKRIFVTTLMVHSSDEWMESTLSMLAAQDAPQAAGSAITYARRYALAPIAGIASSDDDGEEASRTLPQRIRQDAGARSPLQQPIEKSPVGGGATEVPAAVVPTTVSQQPQKASPPSPRPTPTAAPQARAMPPPPGMKPPARAPGS